MAPQLVEYPVEDAPCARLVPLRRVEIENGDADSIQVDAGIMARLRDRVLHEHGGDDEEPGRDGDLPPQEKPLAPGAARATGAAGKTTRATGGPCHGRRSRGRRPRCGPAAEPPASAPRTSSVRVS